MNKKIKRHVWTYISIALLVAIMFNIVSVVTYPMDLSNCNALSTIEYEIPQHNIIWCKKILNAPIYSYYIPQFVGGWSIAFMVVCVIGTIHAVIKEENGDFDEPYTDPSTGETFY